MSVIRRPAQFGPVFSFLPDREVAVVIVPQVCGRVNFMIFDNLAGFTVLGTGTWIVFRG